MPDPTTFLAQSQAQLDAYLDLMEQTWGFRPDVRLSVETQIVVRADFNIAGFAHKGRGILVSERNQKRRTPRQVAREIAAELSDHRQTCTRCGEGAASLLDRLRRMSGRYKWNQGVLDGRPAVRVNEQVLLDDGTPLLGPSGHPVYTTELRYADLPPDAVEEALSPRRAVALRKLLDSGSV